MTIQETQTYRERLIADLTSHSPEAIAENRGGWATDRLNEIRDCEWDLAQAEVDFGRPFILAHYLMEL
jgi:hypothetical protein